MLDTMCNKRWASNPVGAVAATNTAGAGGASRGIGWKGYEDVLRMLPGKSFDEVQRLDDGTIRSKSSKYKDLIYNNL